MASTLAGESELSSNLSPIRDAELQELILGRINQLEEYRTDDNPTNPTLIFSPPSASASSQLPPPEAPPPNSHTNPLIRSKHQSYLYSWHSQDSGAPIAPNRPELQELTQYTDQLEEYRTNDNPTNPTLVFSPSGARPSSQLPAPGAPPPNSHTNPLIRSEHHSWNPHDSGARVAPDRPELQELIEYTDQLEEYHTNDNPTNPTPVFSPPGASPSSQLLPPEAPPPNPHIAPLIRSEHQSYLCSWHLQDSGAPCHYVAPDKPAFLRHLGEIHQVSGGANAMIICQLLDSKTGLACNMPIKRGSFPRHADTHYPLRYHCQYCPPGKSFSRQDSWGKHVRDKHA